MTAQRGDAALVQCSYMAAAYPTLDADDTCHSHRHEDRIVTLARAMAVEFQRPDPSDEQIAWFLDDADAVIDDFVPAPEAWQITDHVTMPEEPPGIVDRFRINGVEYVLQDADWEPARPVRLTTYLSWIEGDDQ
jgi:hypothetical protein